MVVCQWQTVSSARVHLRLMLGPEQVLWKSLAYGWNNYHAHQTTGWPLVLCDNAPIRAEMNYGIELINVNSNASGAQCESAAWCQTETAWTALNAGKSTTWTLVDRSFSACLSAGQSPLWSGMNSSTSFGWIAMKLWADMFPRGWIQLITSDATSRSDISLIQLKYL